MTCRRARTMVVVALLAVGAGAPAALANHLIPEETGARTEIGEGEDARGRPFPAPDTPCGTSVVDGRAGLSVAGSPVTGRACAGANGVGVDAAVGQEQRGSDDPDGSGLGRVAVTADPDPGVVQVYFEDYTPGNQVAKAVWEANDHADCRLLPAHCGEPGVDDHDDDALLFTPVDQTPEDTRGKRPS